MASSNVDLEDGREQEDRTRLAMALVRSSNTKVHPRASLKRQSKTLLRSSGLLRLIAAPTSQRQIGDLCDHSQSFDELASHPDALFG